jgi:predicted transcriptional regulator
MNTEAKDKEFRINVRVDEAVKDELAEVSQRTRLSESTIVREAVLEKLASIKQTHPTYAGAANDLATV